MRRWQDRSKEPSALLSGTQFDGCRLPPGTWRVVHACFATGISAADAGDPVKLQPRIVAVRNEHPTWRAPHATKLAALIQFVNTQGVLERLISTARDEASPGIPDLFLFRVNSKRGVHAGRFVEVKRESRRTGYREPLSRTQRQEHQVLRSLGISVVVVYLVE